METLGDDFTQILPTKFYCHFCNFKCSYKKDWIRHITTRKHSIKQHLVTQSDNFTQKNHNFTQNNYVCSLCCKYFMSRNGLWKHKQKCNENKVDTNNNPKIMMNLVLELVKQNTEFKDLLVEQNKHIIEQNKQNTNLQNKFLEIAKEKTMANCHNTTNNTTNNNNNHFNLQFFLNETCKDAMNISDFVEQINVSLSDLENTGRLGYAEGITRIFVKGLRELDVKQRPIHCSDGKRETLYIKDGNVWEKDDTNKSKLTNAIKKVAHKNIRKINDWVNVHPNCRDSESNKNDLYLKIVSNSMSGTTDEEANDNYCKIKRNIIKEVVIYK
jgi:hypothetical protein